MKIRNQIGPFGLSVFFAACALPNAHAFDCEKAATPVEKAICANDSLKQLDGELQKAYGALLARKILPKKSLVDNQRNWLESVRNGCNGHPPLVGCLTAAYRDRIALLKDPGEKKTTAKKDGRDTITLSRELPWPISVSYALLTPDDSPAYAKINAFAQKEIHNYGCGDPSDSAAQDSPEDGGEDTSNYTSEVTASFVLFKKLKIVALDIQSSEFCGGAHPNEPYQLYYFDRTTGAPIEDLLVVADAKKSALTKLYAAAASGSDVDCSESFAAHLEASLDKEGFVHFGAEHADARDEVGCNGEGIELPYAKAAGFLTAGSKIRKYWN